MDKIDIRDLIIRTLQENSVQENSSSLKRIVDEDDFLEIAESVVKNLPIYVVKNWVAVKDYMPENCDQVFVKYENGKYGINEWWKSDNCWKYQFDNMIVKEWCKPPCS